MAVPIWPASLPQEFLSESYVEGDGDGRLRSPMDAGPGKVRQRFRPARPLTMSVWMTAAQTTILRTFIRDDLAGGSLPFTITSPRTGDDLLVRFAEQMPNYRPLGPDWWEASLDLEIMP